MSKQTDCGSRACPLRFKLGFEQARKSPPSKAAGPMVHLTPLTLYVRLASVQRGGGVRHVLGGANVCLAVDQQQQRKKKASLVDGHPPFGAHRRHRRRRRITRASPPSPSHVHCRHACPCCVPVRRPTSSCMRAGWVPIGTFAHPLALATFLARREPARAGHRAVRSCS